ncbi:hypothetical protein C2G38_2141149 [Gigaspora rosea]|uniref:Uncharacterized protein n=1 Tax=Gigaspora rosea TaxID=44941 RepID=A0A397VKP7_9GLOM|nr:hypothetical protein C2G38_2141149 [Gigaspora rosea]
MAWSKIADTVYFKFGRNCKNIKFLYLTDLLNNLIPLALDVYAVHHQEGYEVTDRHLPQGFVTTKKPSLVALCDYVHCGYTSYSDEFKKKLDEKEPDVTDIGTENENDSDNADKEVDNVPEDLLELENAKESFFYYIIITQIL